MLDDALTLDASQVDSLRFDAAVCIVSEKLDLDTPYPVGCGMRNRSELPENLRWREFEDRRLGMIYAMDGGLWLHRHVWYGRSMAHLVSVDRELLLAYGREVGLPADRLQFKPLKDPRTGLRRDAWHWDLIGEFLPGKSSRP